MTDEPQRDWPVGLTELALLLDAGQALARAERILDRGVAEREVEFRTRLAAVRLWLEKLDGRRSRVAEVARAFESSLAENGDLPPMGAWPAADALRETALEELRRGLPGAPRDVEDWRIRVRRLAALPWIGKHAWDCPSGWLPVLERAAAQAREWIPREALQSCQTVQIKEKYGDLRWYAVADERLAMIIEAAELASGHLCQACGEPGTLRTDRPWYLTLCERHAVLDAQGYGEVVQRMMYPRPRDRD